MNIITKAFGDDDVTYHSNLKAEVLVHKLSQFCNHNSLILGPDMTGTINEDGTFTFEYKWRPFSSVQRRKQGSLVAKVFS